MKATTEVFGISSELRPGAYVDRGGLDATINKFLGRDVHLALRGSSKAGKSWLRQKLLPDAIVIQCRFGHTVIDLYRLALSELGLTLEVTSTSSSVLEGKITAEAEVGLNLLAKAKAALGIGVSKSESTTSEPAMAAIHDLRLISELISLSGRRLVVEDFHYLAIEQRRLLASDLKAFWEYGLYVVIIGIWSENNMLLNFNPDLSLRIREISIGWSKGDLLAVLRQGARDLNLEFSEPLAERLASDSYGNVGILQALALEVLDELGITAEQSALTAVNDMSALESAAMEYSDQLVPIFQTFASNVATGIRKRKNSTAIYAHAMAVVLEQDDDSLLAGVSINTIYERASERESRIQKGNLRLALANIEALQVDEEKRGLVLAYNPTNDEVSVVNRDLLFYRKYQTVSWPWEDIVRESRESVAPPEPE